VRPFLLDTYKEYVLAYKFYLCEVEQCRKAFSHIFLQKGDFEFADARPSKPGQKVHVLREDHTVPGHNTHQGRFFSSNEPVDVVLPKGTTVLGPLPPALSTRYLSPSNNQQVGVLWDEIDLPAQAAMPTRLVLKPAVPTVPDPEKAKVRRQNKNARRRARKAAAKRERDAPALKVADVKNKTALVKAELSYAQVLAKKDRVAKKKSSSPAKGSPPAAVRVETPKGQPPARDVKQTSPRPPNRKERRRAIYGPPGGRPADPPAQRVLPGLDPLGVMAAGSGVWAS
jgi:hypothetical protein